MSWSERVLNTRMTRRDFAFKYLPSLVAGVTLVACAPEVILTPTPPPLATSRDEDTFDLGNTVFRFEGNWPVDKKETLFRHYGKVYPQFTDLYDTEPVSYTQKPVKVILRNTPITPEFKEVIIHGKLSANEGGNVWTIDISTDIPEMMVHELAHLFFGFDLSLDLFSEGIPYGTTTIVGEKIGEDYLGSMRRRLSEVFSFDTRLFNKPKISAASSWLNNPPLYNLRVALSSQGWTAIYRADNDFFAKFRRLTSKAHLERATINPYKLMETAFRGNLGFGRIFTSLYS